MLSKWDMKKKKSEDAADGEPTPKNLAPENLAPAKAKKPAPSKANKV